MLKLPPSKKIAALGLFLLCLNFAYSGIIPSHDRIFTASTPIIANTPDAMALAQVAGVYPGPGIFSDASVLDKITLGVDHSSLKYLPTEEEIRVDLLLNQWDVNGNLSISTPQLILKYNPFNSANPYIDKSILSFNGAYKVEITITGITKVAPGGGISTTTVFPANLFIDVDIQLERYYNFSTTATVPMLVNAIGTLDTIDIDCDNIVDEIQVSWPNVPQAEEYELEWTFINNYGISLPLFLTSSASEYNFKNNSTRITTTFLFYKITNIFEHGYLVYRVRPIGRDYLNPSQVIVGVWSKQSGIIGPSMPDNGFVSTVGTFYYVWNPHEQDKNWQYSATFAEEGKKKEVISYFDGSLRNRQSVTKTNSELNRNAIVGETIYDYQGRPALNVLPTPVAKSICGTDPESSIKYYPLFNQDDSTFAYTRNDFDVDPSFADSCNTFVNGMSTVSGSSNYYSPANPNQVDMQAFVPDGEKYPFTRIEYTSDNTGRIRRQGGVGPDYQLGSNHETKYFYGWPNQVQLDRLFGSEVGDAAHYKKNLVIDANGQVSVSYLDQEGRTIATSLAGNSPKNSLGETILENLPSNIPSVEFNVDLFAKDANGHSVANEVQADAIIFTSQLLVAYASDHVFDYSLTIDKFEDECLADEICFTCVYDLEIKVTDDCGRPVEPQVGSGIHPVKKTIGNFTIDANGNYVFSSSCPPFLPPLTEADAFTLPNLAVGNYTVTKILTINKDARDFYVNEYLDSTKNDCLLTLWDFVGPAVANVDTSDCNITCETCIESMMRGYATVEDARDAWVADGNGTELEFDLLLEQCGAPCKGINWCEVTYQQLLLDVSPDGQYAQFQTTASGSSPDLNLSVLNASNVLPKNFASPPIAANWLNPNIIVNGTSYPYYLDDDGTRSIIKLSTFGTNFIPSVASLSSTLIKYDAIGGFYYTYPENLAYVADFVTAWKSNWAKSLVQYHPEYCYYESCESYNKEQGADDITSDGFDELLTKANTFQEAITAGLIDGSTYLLPGVPAINKINDFFTFNTTPATDPFDPYTTNPFYNFGAPYTLQSKFLNYKTLDIYNYSMPEMAAIAVRCGTLYGTTPLPTSTCNKFGTDLFLPATDPDNIILNDSVRDLEWNMFKNFYLAEKRTLQQLRADVFAKYICKTGYNGCIGNSEYDPFLEGMISFGSFGSTFLTSLYFDAEQPCSAFFNDLYENKKKRFINNNDFPTPSPSEMDYQMFLQTGQCPTAIDLQYLLGAISGQDQLINTTGISLSSFGQFTNDLYAELSGGTTPATFIPYTWQAVSGTTGDILLVNIVNSTSSTTACTVVLDKTGTGITNWNDVAGISQLMFTGMIGTEYGFSATAAISDGLGNIIDYKTITGYSCFKISGCNFPPVCDPNDLAIDLSNLWSALQVNDDLSDPSVNLNVVFEKYQNFISTSIKSKLSTTSTALEWQYDLALNQFLLFDVAAPAKKIIIKFTGFSVSGFNVSNLYANNVVAFANVTSNNANFFTVNGIDASGNVLVVIDGSVELLDGTTTGLSMGDCGLPDPLACEGEEYQLVPDLENLLEDVLLDNPFTTNIDLTQSPEYTALIQSYFPSGLISTSSVVTTSSTGGVYTETLTFTIVSSTPGSATSSEVPDSGTPPVTEIESCELVLYHDYESSLENFIHLISFGPLVPYGTPGLDGSYHEFYAIATYSADGKSFTDTIFGRSCLPLKPCEPCSTIPPPGCVKCDSLSILAPSIVCIDERVTFTSEAENCDGIPDLLYNFGDGTVSSSASHTYTSAGTYVVTVSTVRTPECHGLQTLIASVSVTVLTTCSGTPPPPSLIEPIYFNKRDSIRLASGSLLKDSTLYAYQDYSKQIYELDSTNGWNPGDSLYVVPADYSEFYISGDKLALETHTEFVKNYDSVVDNRAYLHNVKSYIKDYGSYTNSTKEYERYEKAINKYNLRAIAYGAPTLVALPDSTFYESVLSDSISVYIKYLKEFPDNGLVPVNEIPFLAARGSLVDPTDACVILYKQYVNAYIGFAETQSISPSCPEFKTVSPLYSYEEFVKNNLCTTSGLIIFNNYVNSFTLTPPPCPTSMPKGGLDDKTLQRLYTLFKSTILEYDSSAYAVFHNHILDSEIYPTFQLFVERDLVDCIPDYISYLKGYRDAIASAPLPLPVDVDHYSSCLTPASPPVENPCKDAYSDYLTAIADYNEFISLPANVGLKLPPITNIYPYEDFTTEGFCYCVDGYVAFLQTIINGTADLSKENRDELYLEMDIANSCAELLKPPCAPTVPQDTLSTPLLTQYSNPCAEYMIDMAVVNATNAYNEYIDTLTTWISAQYTKHCLTAVENFNLKYDDKEYHFTLYYYDQAGNLVRTIPPEGVEFVDMATYGAGINYDRTNNKHTVFTEHRMATTYEYNSLNQLVRQNMPDHDQMNIFDYAYSNGLDSRLKVTATQFVNTTRGYLSGYVEATATVPQRGYLYTTNDGGTTWTKMNDIVASDLKRVQMLLPFVSGDPSPGFAIGNHGIIVRTLDGGNTWDLLDQKYSPTGEINFTDLYFFNPTTSTNNPLLGIVLADNEEYLLTIDGGLTYTNAGFIGTAPYLKNQSITYDGSFYITGTNALGESEIYKSDPIPMGITSWPPFNWTQQKNIRSTDLTKIQLFPATNNGFAIGADGTLMKTFDKGKSWRTLLTGTAGNFVDIHFKKPALVTDSILEAVAIIEALPGEGQIYKTTNGGLTWTLMSTAGEFYNSFNFYSNEKGYALGLGGKMKRVVMTGSYGLVSIVTPNTSAGDPIDLYAAAFNSTGDKGWIVGDNTVDQKIYYTTNGTSPSITWTGVNAPLTSDLFKDIYYGTIGSADDEGFLLTKNGALHRLYFTGSTYIVSTVDPGLYIDIDDNITSAKVFALTTSGQLMSILKSDISTTTTMLTTIPISGAGPTPGATSIYAKKDNNVFVIGLQGELFVADLTGSSWANNTYNTRPLPLNDVQKAGTSVIYAVGKQGSILQTTDGIKWATLPSGTVEQFNGIKFNTTTATIPYQGLIAGDNGLLLRDDVVAASYSLTPIVLTTTENLNDIALNAAGKAYIAGGQGTLVSIPDILSPVPSIAAPNPAQNFNGVALVPGGLGTVMVVGNNSVVFTYNTDASTGITSGAKIKPVFTPVLNDVNFANTQNGYIVGKKEIIRHTTDGGLSWQYVLPKTSSGGFNIPTLNGVWTTANNKSVIIGDNGYIANISGVSVDVNTVSITTADLRDVVINNASGIGYFVGDAAGGSNTVYKTINYGGSLITPPILPVSSHWSDISSTLTTPTKDFTSVHVFTNGNCIAVGKKRIIYIYDGSSWISQSALSSLVAANTDYTDVFFHDDRTGYIVGTKGAGTGSVLLKCTGNINVFTLPANGIVWQRKALFGANGILDSTNVDFKTIDFATRYRGFMGGAYNSYTPPNAHFSRLINDESNTYSTRFWYDRLGRMVVSQNTKQFNRKYLATQLERQDYSYTIYDELGRISEVGETTDNPSSATRFSTIFGEYINGFFNPNVISDVKYAAWLAANGRREVTKTYYDIVSITGLPLTQENLRKRVASVTYEDVFDSDDQTFQNATHYTYDIHGNVTALLQDNPTITITGQRWKRTDYEYDLISGKVNVVRFQDGKPDAFYHFYGYDSDNRITEVYTSNYPQANSIINSTVVMNSTWWEKDAKYFYYDHGPLSRVEMGSSKSQGMDYAYTLQGWIKGVNSNLVTAQHDMGQDGFAPLSGTGFIFNLHRDVAKDAFGYTLNYHDGDYTPISSLVWSPATKRFEAVTPGSDLAAARYDLFNGNITSMVTTIKAPKEYTSAPNEVPNILPLGTAYKYDQLNRIKEMQAYANLEMTPGPGYNEWGTGSVYSGMYHNKFNYDANGNIELQERADQAGVIFDRMKYNYKHDVLGNVFQNRLYSVNEVVDGSLPAPTNALSADDIDDQGIYDETPSVGTVNDVNNYRYDEIGNLKHDEQEEIEKIEWTVYGKIKRITRKAGSVKSDLEFSYDASGNRISKIEKPRDATGVRPSIEWKTTYYARDAQGNIMTTYKQEAPGSIPSFKVKERNLFGSSRLGIENTEIELIAALPTANPFDRIMGNKSFEASNHLGNVLVVFTDKTMPRDDNADNIIDYFQPDVINTFDYSAFGAPLKERTLAKQICTPSTTVQTSYVLNTDMNDATTMGWTAFGGASVSNVLSRLAITSSFPGGTRGASKPFSAISGTLYSVSAKIDKGGCSGSLRVRIKDGIGGTVVDQLVIGSGIVTVSFTFTASSTATYTMEVVKVGGSGCTFYADDMQVSWQETITTSICVDASKYRYGFNGKEKDDEMHGNGNVYDYGFRIYNPRLGKFLSVDPLAIEFPYYTSYQFAGNKPIVAIDLDGAEDVFITEKDGKQQMRLAHDKDDVEQVLSGVSPTMRVHYKSKTTSQFEGPNKANELKIFKIIAKERKASIIRSSDAIKKAMSEGKWKGEKVVSDQSPTFDIPEPKPPKPPIKGVVPPIIPPNPGVVPPIVPPLPDVKSLDIGVNFDADEAEFDSPTDDSFGSDKLDEDLKEVIGILRKDPRNTVTIKVSTANANANVTSSNFGNSSKLLEARKQAVLDEFKRLAPDLNPNQVNVYHDNTSYKSNVGFSGTVSDFKK